MSVCVNGTFTVGILQPLLLLVDQLEHGLDQPRRPPDDVEAVPHVHQLEAGQREAAALSREAVHFGDGELLLRETLPADALLQRGDGPATVLGGVVTVTVIIDCTKVSL